MTRLQVVDVCHLDRPRTVRRQRHALCSLAGERAQRHEFIRHMASTHGYHGPGTGKTWGVYRFSLAVTHLQPRGIPNIEPKKKKKTPSPLVSTTQHGTNTRLAFHAAGAQAIAVAVASPLISCRSS